MSLQRLTLWERLKDENKQLVEQSREEYPHMTESCIMSLKQETYVIDLTVSQLDNITMLCNTHDWNKIYELFN